MKVKDLIHELLEMNQEAEVLYAYGEYGSNSTHHFISGKELVAVDGEGNVIVDDDQDIITCDPADLEKDREDTPKLEEGQEWAPAIKLFAW